MALFQSPPLFSFSHCNSTNFPVDGRRSSSLKQLAAWYLLPEGPSKKLATLFFTEDDTVPKASPSKKLLCVFMRGTNVNQFLDGSEKNMHQTSVEGEDFGDQKSGTT